MIKSFRESIPLLSKHNIILCVGDEPFYQEQIKNKVKQDNPTADIIKLDPEENDLSSIYFNDLFSSKRIFIIPDFTHIKDFSIFMEYSGNDKILLFAETAGRSKAYKELQEAHLTVDCSRPKAWQAEDDAISKITGFLKAKGYSISEENAVFLYQNIGFDLFKLMLELQKLTLWLEPQEIKKEHLEEIGINAINYNLFDLIDLILENKKEESLNLLEKIYVFEKDPSILLISLWYTHLENLLFIKSSGYPVKELISHIKMPPFVIEKKLIPQSKKITEEKILISLEYLTDTDFNLRKGSFDTRIYIEKFILDF